ncbi:MAG: hypothetical protein SOZ59_00530 [Candidatus Limivivens sp.]|nr:hypothetical protein [Candidatus Limivivens sp.]
MEKKRSVWGILGILFLVLCLFGTSARVFAATDFNLIQAVDRKPVRTGTWHEDENGRYFQYTNGKYPKKVWLKIEGKYYYFNGSGYAKAGWVCFKGNRYFLSRRSNRYGQLLLGFQKIGGNTYHFSKKTAQMSFGWQLISKKWYHFDETTGIMDKNVWVDGKYLKADGSMAVNCWVGTQYVGEDGMAVPEAAAQGKLIFVGDSRTVGMKESVGGKAVYIAAGGEGYEWFLSTGLPKLEKQLAKYPLSRVVLNLGVNDLGNVADYCACYRELMKKYPDVSFYILSVNPMETKKSSVWNATNKMIRSFNKIMRTAFPENYLDCYAELVNTGFKTVDGLHYTVDTYRKIYNFVVKAIS